MSDFRWIIYNAWTNLLGVFLHPLIEPALRLHELVRERQGWEWSYISAVGRPSIHWDLRPPSDEAAA